MFFVRDFFRKCEQIRNFLRIFSNVLNKSLTTNFILCVVVSSHLVLMLPPLFQKNIYALLCAIQYNMYNLKNVKNTHGELLLSVVCNFPITLLHRCFSGFSNCTNGTKSCKASHMRKLY